jgi:hypothetical protein
MLSLNSESNGEKKLKKTKRGIENRLAWFEKNNK